MHLSVTVVTAFWPVQVYSRVASYYIMTYKESYKAVIFFSGTGDNNSILFHTWRKISKMGK